MTWRLAKGTIPPTSPWTVERMAALEELWRDGLSCSQIAGALGGGITRNAVIGKVHRSGLHKSYPRGRLKRKQPRTPRKRYVMTKKLGPPEFAPTPPPRAEAWNALPGSVPVNLVDLTESTCRWPLGDTRPFVYCGCQAVAGSSYCATHKAMGASPAKPKSTLFRMSIKGAFHRVANLRILEDA